VDTGIESYQGRSILLSLPRSALRCSCLLWIWPRLRYSSDACSAVGGLSRGIVLICLRNSGICFLLTRYGSWVDIHFPLALRIFLHLRCGHLESGKWFLAFLWVERQIWGPGLHRPLLNTGLGQCESGRDSLHLLGWRKSSWYWCLVSCSGLVFYTVTNWFFYFIVINLDVGTYTVCSAEEDLQVSAVSFSSKTKVLTAFSAAILALKRSCSTLITALMGKDKSEGHVYWLYCLDSSAKNSSCETFERCFCEYLVTELPECGIR